MAKVKILENGCWQWLGQVQNGYGKFYWNGRQVYAHRAAIEMKTGVVPKKIVMHLCDNPICVNPEHLKEGSQAENMRECVERGRHHMRKKTHCPKGHPYSGDNLYQNPYTRVRQCRQCQKELMKRYRRGKG